MTHRHEPPPLPWIVAADAAASGPQTDGWLRRMLACLLSAVLHCATFLVLACLFLVFSDDSPLVLHSGTAESSLVELDAGSLELPVSLPDVAPVPWAKSSLDAPPAVALPFAIGPAGMGLGPPQGFTGKIEYAKRHGLDLFLVFDSTGSMRGVTDAVKDNLSAIAGLFLERLPKTRIGLCTYRDKKDEYLVKGVPLTNDLDVLRQFLSRVTASGGGDRPEAVSEGLAWPLTYGKFREDALKAVLLFGDAPPHDLPRCLELAKSVHAEGGFVSTITCGQPYRRRSKGGENTGEVLPEFYEIARVGTGEAYLQTEPQRLVEETVVLAFGSEHREKIAKFFDLKLASSIQRSSKPRISSMRARRPKSRAAQRAASTLQLARQFHDAGKVDLAKKWLQRLIKEHPETPQAKQGRELLEQLNRPDAKGAAKRE